MNDELFIRILRVYVCLTRSPRSVTLEVFADFTTFNFLAGFQFKQQEKKVPRENISVANREKVLLKWMRLIMMRLYSLCSR